MPSDHVPVPVPDLRFAPWLATLLVTILWACGGAAPRDTTVPDDLELDGALDRRAAISDDDPSPDPEPPPPSPTPELRAEIVAPGPGGAPDGARIDLAVRDAGVADVLRMIAAVIGVGVVVPDDIDGTITLELRGVTWRQAIDVIADLEGLAITDQDGVLLVTRRPR